MPAQTDVEAVYRAVLNRNPDSGGLNYWTGLLGQAVETRLQIVEGIRNSPEHFGQEIDAFYLALFGALLIRLDGPIGFPSWKLE